MLSEFAGLSERFLAVAAKGVAFFETHRHLPIYAYRDSETTWEEVDPTLREEMDAIRAGLRELIVPIYYHLAHSPLLHAVDHRNFSDLVREMNAALELRKLRPKTRDDRCLSFDDAEEQYHEAFRRAKEYLDLVPTSAEPAAD